MYVKIPRTPTTKLISHRDYHETAGSKLIARRLDKGANRREEYGEETGWLDETDRRLKKTNEDTQKLCR